METAHDPIIFHYLLGIIIGYSRYLYDIMIYYDIVIGSPIGYHYLSICFLYSIGSAPSQSGGNISSPASAEVH